MTSLTTLLKSYTQKPIAPFMLFGVSVSESVFFPIPPDVMLVPMCIGHKSQWLRFAIVTTIGSIIGAMLGFLIGSLAFDALGMPILESLHAVEHYHTFEHYYGVYGAVLLLLAGVTPIPFKVFTIASGALGMAFAPFVFLCILGRSFRFLLVGYVASRYGDVALRMMGNKWLGAVLGVLCIISIILLIRMTHG